MVLGFNNANVRFNPTLAERQATREEQGLAPLGVNLMLKPVIARLATEKPLWEFVAYKATDSTVVSFIVKMNGELLGEIGSGWIGNDYAIYVKNPRIAASLTRSDRYKTTDQDKAVLKVKKMFGAMSTNERVSQASSKAATLINSACNTKWSEINELNAKITRIATKYVMDEGLQVFTAWLQAQGTPTAKDTLLGMDNKVRLETEMLTIQGVRDHFNNNKAVLVVKDAGKYIVKVGDKLDLYDDNTLPQELCGKLGMLKLVEAEQFVTDTGCRINDETFVLLLDEVKHES